MEKASDVYNKLKLRFVGKAEVAAKPKTENKEPEDNEETKNTGKKATPWILPPFGLHITSIFYFLAYVFFYINLNVYFLDSTPVNGDTEQKADDVEVEDKPKSPAQEENNDDTASSPNRWTYHVKQFPVFTIGLGNWQDMKADLGQ